MGEVGEANKAPVRKGEIWEQRDFLDKALEELKGQVMDLSSRLSPILAPSADTAKEAVVEKKTVTGLGADISIACDKVWALRKTITNLLTRIEI